MVESETESGYYVVAFTDGRHRFYDVKEKYMTLMRKAKTPNVGDNVLVLIRPDRQDPKFVTSVVEQVHGTKVTVFGRKVFDIWKDTFVIVGSKKRSADSNRSSMPPLKRSKSVVTEEKKFAALK